MAISFKCKKCGKDYNVGDDKAGKRVKCRQCSNTIQIPSVATGEFDEDYGGSDEWGDSPPLLPSTPTRKKSSGGKDASRKKKLNQENESTTPNIIAAIGGVVVLGGLIWSMIAIFGGGDAEDRNPTIANQDVEALDEDVLTSNEKPESLNEFALTAAEVKKHMSPEQLEMGDPIENRIGMVMVPIRLGKFQMGMSKLERSADRYRESNFKKKEINSGPPHTVVISKPFYMSATEVTQSQWKAVMGTSPWVYEGYVGKWEVGAHIVATQIREGPNLAASFISWDDAVEFCEKLSEREGVEYRLPTEAEWEYACRAGTSTRFSFGNDASLQGKYSWHRGNCYDIGEGYPHRVGQKLPNPWGLYDMHGNVWEWCHDFYGPYGDEKVVMDPSGPVTSDYHTVRGGDNRINSVTLASSYRSYTALNGIGGFRPVMTIPVGEEQDGKVK